MIEEVQTAENEPAEKPAKKTGGKLKVIFILLVLALAGVGGYSFYNTGKNLFAPKTVALEEVKVQTPAPINAVVIPQNEVPQIVPAPKSDAIISLLPPIIADAAPQEPALAAPAVAAPVPPQNNKIFVLYLAARDLRDSVSSVPQFKKELAFVRAVSLDFPELQSKIELLEIASGQGIATKETLLKDLNLLRKNLRNKNHGSFVDNLKNSLSRLITITKIEGDVKAGDYESVIKRAEIAIEKNDFVQAKLDLAILGADAADLTRKIDNLNNVNEITEYIVDFTKSKIVSQ